MRSSGRKILHSKPHREARSRGNAALRSIEWCKALERLVLKFDRRAAHRRQADRQDGRFAVSRCRCDAGRLERGA